MTKIFISYLAAILIMSLITFIAYSVDKQKAIKGKYRTKEKTLLLMSFFLGALGGIFAMYFRRHKNKHWYFVLVNLCSLTVHIIIGYILFGR